MHEAGGFMQLGSSTTFVGDGLFPVARGGDGASDGQTAVTDGGDLFIGGTDEPARARAIDGHADGKVRRGL